MKLRMEQSERSRLGICTYYNQMDGRCQILPSQQSIRFQGQHIFPKLPIKEIAKINSKPTHADEFPAEKWDEHHSYLCRDMPKDGAPPISPEVAAAQRQCTGYKELDLRSL